MKLNTRTASILLSLVISARATSFLFSKMCLETMTAYSLISVRFLLAAIIMFLLLHKRIINRFDKKDMAKGALFGTLYFCTLLCEHIGLKTTNSGTASLLENMAIVLVPLIESGLSRKFPHRKTLLRAFSAVIGVGFLTYKGQSFQLCSGELFLLCAAVFYSSAIIVTSRMSVKGDPLNMGFFQVCTIALWGTAAAVLSGSYTLPASGGQYAMVFMLAAVCTCFGFTFQPMAQSKIDSGKASLFCAINPMIASILGIAFLHEGFTPFTVIGQILILFALIVR